MKTIWRLAIGFFLPAFAISCFNPPEYPVIPEIDFENISFIDVPDGSTLSDGTLIPDTLILKVNFKDGDGDLGLSDDDLQLSDETAKYAERFYFDKSGQKWVTDDASALGSDFLRYSSKKSPPFDTLPNFVSPYDCINWEILTKTTGTTTVNTDTVYFQLNPNHYNIFVDFLINDNGTYEEYDFRKELCTTYDGRFPILSKDLSQKNPLQGTIRYAMEGTGFKFIFSIKTMKLRVRIQDRALNKSNIIETDPFTLSSIK
jgi:hypothetical protein